MARVSSQELLERLKNGKIIPALLLLGDEPYLRDACRKILMEEFVVAAARDWGPRPHGTATAPAMAGN